MEDKWKSKPYLYSDLKVDKDSSKVTRVQTCTLVGKRVLPIMTYDDFLRNGYLFRSTYMGLTHARRDCVVADIDLNYEESCGAMMDKLVDLGIQKPNCVVINRRTYPDRPDSDQSHYQMVWFVDEPWVGDGNKWSGGARESYNWVTKTLNQLLGGDPNFRGSYFKNPFCDFEQETIWLDREKLPRRRFENYLRFKCNDTSWLEDLKSATPRGLERIDYGSEGKHTTLLEETILGRSTEELSRNTIAHAYACKMGLRYRCTHKGRKPPRSMVKEWVIEAEREVVLREPSKGDIEPPENIANTVRSACAFIESEYDPNREYNLPSLNKYDPRDREEGRRTQKVTATVNSLTAQRLRQSGEVSCARELMDMFGVKLCTARGYLRNQVDDSMARPLLNDWLLDHMKDNTKGRDEVRTRIREVFEWKGWDFTEFDYLD